MEAKFLMEREMTPMITFMKASERKRRVTLNTLNVLKILALLKAETAFADPVKKSASTKEIVTMAPSKQFIRSLTYSMGKK